MKLLATAGKPAARSAAMPPEPTVNSKERELEARIAELERRLQEQQAAQPAQASDLPGNYPESPPQLLQAGSYGSQTAEYNSGYYPSPYYAPPLAYSFVVVQARPLARGPHPPAHAGQPQFARHTRRSAAQTQGFVGATPQFVGPTPRFVGPTPQFVGPTPQFISRSAPAQSAPARPATHHGARGGGSTQHPRR